MTFPSLQLPGSFAIPSTAPVYIDGIPAALVKATPSAKADNDQGFWSSQPREAGDRTAEQLTVSLAQQRLVNYLTLDVAHFPHVLTACWWDGARWQPLLGNSGSPLEIITTGSVPSIVDNPAAYNAGLNPYHYGAGHWVHHDEDVRPVLTSKLLLHLARLGRTTGLQGFPVNPHGKHVPYPLGVRNLDFGSRMLSSQDVPRTTRSPITLSMRQPFTTTADINGSPVQVAVRENRACDLLRGGTWRCAPQPHAESVVSLYLDSRDATGSAQLIERFYLEPVTSGVRFSLYYSPVPPPADPDLVFPALDDPLSPDQIVAAGTTLPAAGSRGIVFPNSPGWLTMASQGAGTAANSPWWTGIEIMPAFSSSDPGTYVIADAGLLQLSFAAGEWAITMPPAGQAPINQPSGAVLASWASSFAAGDRLQFIAGFDGTSFFAWSPAAGLFQVPATLPVPAAPVFRFGGLQNIDPAQPVLHGNYRLTAFVLKQQQVDITGGTTPASVPDDFLSFAADAGGYVFPPLASESGTTDNAVARFSPEYLLGTTCPWGFVGGLGQAYEACSWIPVARDYVLHRGYVEFDPVLAAAWKFEFTHLQPEPCVYIKPVGHQARFHPGPVKPSPSQLKPLTPAALDPGMTINQATAPSASFRDAPVPSADADPAVPLPTEALYATDPGSLARMAGQGGSLYNFQPWQPPHVIARWSAAQPHYYQQDEVKMASRVAYFVALSGIKMFRIDYTAADDTGMYLDTFADTRNVDPATLVPGGWSWQPGVGLVVPSNLAGAARAASVTFNSAHAVTGVQFATVQSDPVQLLDDPDFSEPGFKSWGPAGDALPLAPAAVSAQLGNMVSVARGAGSPVPVTADPQSSWAYLQDTYGSWTALMSGVPGWADFGLPPASEAMGGIAYTGTPAATTAVGRLYAAARVFSPVALSAPLYLQLLDGLSGAVIAESEQTVAGGSVTEWFTGFTLGSVQISTTTWAANQAAYATWAAIAAAAPAWSQLDTTVTPLGSTVTVRLIQKTATGDTWDVDNISVFEDALVWEFSNDGGQTWETAFDIRNNPRGAITFPVASPGQGTQLKWRVSAYRPGISVGALAIRPWYATWPRGIVPRPAGVGHGPNLSPQDQFAPVERDPRWQLSSSPLPDSWFFRARQLLSISAPASSFPGPELPEPDATLGSALVYQSPASAPPGEQTYTDIYTDTYTDQYVPADGGDVYTDTYTGTYGQDYLVTTGTVRPGAAALAAAASLSADAIGVPPLASQLGVDLGPVSGSSSSIATWSSATGEPVPVRRVAFGNQIPAALTGSLVAADAGVRRVWMDFRPDSSTTPGQLNTFLASCQAGGLRGCVSIWAGAEKVFTRPQDYFALVAAYVSAIRLNGFEAVFTVGNDSIAHNNALAAWYPGDDLVDIIAPTFYCTGPPPGSGGDTLTAVSAFADQHGKPLGLARFGVDRSKYTSSQGEAFLDYVRRIFAARKAAGKASADLIYLATGSYSLTGSPAATRVAQLAGFDVPKGTWASANSQLGPGDTHRIFYSGALPASFDADGTPSHVTCIVSYKTANTNVVSYVNSIPANRSVIMIYYHEPEDNFSTGASFVSVFKSQAALIRAQGRYDGRTVRVCMCANGYRYRSAVGDTEALSGNFLRGLGGYADLFAIDVYQGGGENFPAGSPAGWSWPSQGLQNYDAFQNWLSVVTNAAVVGTVRPLAIVEYGISDAAGNTNRHDRIALDQAYLTTAFTPGGGGAVSAYPLQAWCYWWESVYGDPNQAKFSDTATIQLWQQIEAGGAGDPFYAGLLAAYQQLATAL